MNRDGDGRAAQAFVERELHWFERYARGVPGAEALLTELVLLHRRAGEAWDERTRKNVFTAATQLGHFAEDLRIAARPSLADVLQRGSR